MADKRYRSGALKRKLKHERQRREKEALSKLKTITGFFTPVTPQPAVPVLAERSVDNNLLEETAGADLISRAEQPISGLSSFLSEAMEAATDRRLHQIGLQLLLILTLLILLAGVKLLRMCVLTGRGKVHWHKVGLTLDVRYSHIWGPSLKLHAILVYTFLTSIAFEQNDLQS